MQWSDKGLFNLKAWPIAALAVIAWVIAVKPWQAGAMAPFGVAFASLAAATFIRIAKGWATASHPVASSSSKLLGDCIVAFVIMGITASAFGLLDSFVWSRDLAALTNSGPSCCSCAMINSN